jgi:hypothetical protein
VGVVTRAHALSVAGATRSGQGENGKIKCLQVIRWWGCLNRCVCTLPNQLITCAEQSAPPRRTRHQTRDLPIICQQTNTRPHIATHTVCNTSLTCHQRCPPRTLRAGMRGVAQYRVATRVVVTCTQIFLQRAHKLQIMNPRCRSFAPRLLATNFFSILASNFNKQTQHTLRCLPGSIAIDASPATSASC